MLRDFKLKWWQAAMYETAMISLGIIIGNHFRDYLLKIEIIFWILFVVFGFYIIKIFLSQQIEK